MLTGKGEPHFLLSSEQTLILLSLILRLSRDIFDDLVRKIVSLVHGGIIRPAYGAQVLHGCASLLGMDLASPLPNTAVGVCGLVKSNDLATAHGLMARAFEEFGDVVDLAVTPLNHGVGFVRFAGEESAARVLDVYRTGEILIQDVAVRIVELG